MDIRLSWLALAALTLSTPALADLLHSATRVSDVGLTGNSIEAGNTSRNLAVGADGTIYAAFQGTNGIRVARSVNGGQSFGATVQVTATNAEVEIAVSSSGIVYVTWVDGGQAQVSRSVDGGQTFSAPVVAGSASTTVHMATDADMVYLIDQAGVSFLRSDDDGLTFTQVVPSGGAQAYSDVHVDTESGDVFIQVDDPTVKYYVSTDQGATFGAMTTPNPGGGIFYSVGALSSGPQGRYLLTTGAGTAGLRIDVDANTSEAITFGDNNSATGRSLMADRCGNVVDGFISSTSDLQFAVSNDIGDTFTAPTTVAAVPNGADQHSNVYIDPTNGNLLFLYTQSGEVFLNAYEGELPCYEPRLSTAALVFGQQLVNKPSPVKFVQVSNGGDGPIQIQGITTTGNFSQTNDCPASLAIGASCTITVTFTPTATGLRTGQVRIATDVFPEPRTVKLTGRGVATAPAPSLSASSLSFGNRGVDTEHELTFTLTNEGNLPLDLDSFDTSGPFTVTENCPDTLAADESCEVTVRFTPTSVTDFSGELTILSNSPGGPMVLPLSGAGVPVHEVTASIDGEGTILPESVSVTEGETATFTVTPAEGYSIASVTGCGGTLDGNTFTTGAITGACEISVVFQEDAVVVEAKGKGGGGSFGFLTLGGLLLTFLARCARALRPGLGALCVLPGLAQADDYPLWYAGASVGTARSDVSADDVNARLDDLGYDVVATVDDRSRTAWAVHGGWRWSKYFGSQLSYVDLGTIETGYTGSVAEIVAFLDDANRIHPQSADGLELAFTARYPLHDRFALTAQLGGFYWKSEYRVWNEAGESVSRDDDGFDLSFGAGAEFGLTPRAALTGGWSRYDIDGESVDLVSIGARYSW